MKLLITGGYGFIGSSIAQKFYQEGYKIFIIDNLSTGKKENLKINHKFYNLDINDLKCEKIFKLHKFDLVIHAAAISDKDLTQKDIYANKSSNIMGLVNILQLSVKYNVKTFVYPSSAEVYGENTMSSIDEKIKTKAISPLGLEKTIGEKLCLEWKDLYDLNIIIFRIGNIYGPKQNIYSDSFLLPYLMERIYYGESIPLGELGNKRFNLLYISDLSNSIYSVSNLSCKEETCLFADDELPIINISSKKNYSLEEILKILSSKKKLSKKKTNFTPYINFVDMNTNKLNRIYNQKEEFSINDGLNLLHNWYKEQKSSKNKKNNTLTMIKDFFTPENSYVPILVNISLFLIIFAFNYMFPNQFRLQITDNIDINYLYIILISIIYGNKQSILSIIFSIFTYIANFLFVGGNFYALTYNKAHIIHIAFYIILGSIVKLFITKYKNIINNQKYELSTLDSNYKLLNEIYYEAISSNKNIENEVTVSHKPIIENQITASNKLNITDKYIKGTQILAPLVFNNILQSFEEKRITYNIDYVLIKIDDIPEIYNKNNNTTAKKRNSLLKPIKTPFNLNTQKTQENKISSEEKNTSTFYNTDTKTSSNNNDKVIDYSALYMDISIFLRPNDYIGIDRNNIIYIALSNTNKQTANVLLSRLRSKNITSHFINTNKNTIVSLIEI
ncbi:NAD-dependent epimerase/dehydratase family protein [Clostridium sp. DL1XJH146]